MKIGKVQKIDWNKYKTSKFHFPEDINNAECGAYALYAITKKPYNNVVKLSKNGHWPTSVMLGFLKKNGYEVIPVTLGNLVECHSLNEYSTKVKLTGRNVLLLDQRFYEGENSWAVIYGNMYGHSGDACPIDALEFINFPIEAAYLIYHKTWGNT